VPPGCSDPEGEEDASPDGEADGDGDTDVDGDGDGDSDSDGDTDGDSDGDADGDADGDSDGDVDGDGDGDPAPPPAYGIFQLYGDEYSGFRDAMGFSLEDYWDFVDEHVSRLGVRFTRTNTLLIWALVEPALGGGYVWDNGLHTDAVIQAVYAPSEGKEMDILLVISPGRGGPGDPPYPTGLESEYQEFVRAAVERYDGDGIDDGASAVRVKYWQVMNEPFFALESGQMTVEQYAELARLTEEAVHEADPAAMVVLGDMGRSQRDILPLISDVDFSAVDVHYWSTDATYQFPMLEMMRSGMDTWGLADVEIWMCEFGTYTNQPGRLPPHTDAYQARWLVKAMVANRAAGASRILWNNLVAWTDFGGSSDSQFNFMGLISTGEDSGDEAADLGRERPAYFAFQRLLAATGTAAAELVGEVEGLSEPARAVAFAPRDGSPTIHVAWSDGATTSIDLPCSLASARVTTLVPDEAGVFEESVVPAAGGLVSLELGEDPVLVEPTP
jgi:hypothetical protein